MANLDTPIKIRDINGNLQRFTTSEESYLAYQIGLHLGEATEGDVGTITTTATANTAIGTYSNTFYNEPIGTHPGSSLSTGSVNTTLYIANGTASEADSDNRLPIAFETAPQKFQEMADSDYDILTTRLIGVAMTNEYPGSYRLASTTPGGDYDTHLLDVFTDTRADGNTVNFSIFQRQSITPPTTVEPVYIRRSAGATGTYEGLQEYTDRMIKVSFGQRAKNLINVANSVGWYQLRSSSEGAPVDPGTWVARGTATDTRNITEVSNFATDYIADYVGDFAAFYGRDVDKSYAAAYAGFASFGNVLPTTDPTVLATTDATSFANVLPTTDATILATTDPTSYANVLPTTEPTILPTTDPTSFGNVLPTTDPTVLATTDPTSFGNVLPTVFGAVQPTNLPTNFFVSDPTSFTVSDFTVLGTTDPTVLAVTDFTQFFIPGTDFTRFPGTDFTTLPTTFFAFFGPAIEPFQTTIPGSDPTFLPTLGGQFQPTSFTLGTWQPTTTPAVQPTTDPTNLPTTFFVANQASVITVTDATSDPTSFTVTDPTSFGNVLPTTDATILATTDPTSYANVLPTTDATVLPTTDPTSFGNVLPTTDPTILATTDATSFANVLPTTDATILATTDPTSYLSPSNYVKDYVGQYIRQIEVQYSRIYSKAYNKQYGGETLISTTTTIETYTLYVRTA